MLSVVEADKNKRWC